MNTIHAGYAVSSFTLKLHGWSDTRRFVVVRELEREDKSAVGRRLIDVPGYTFRVWGTNRTEDAATLWRDYNGRATIEQRIEELKSDMHAKGFCTHKFFATEAAMLSIFAYNLLAVYQAQVTPSPPISRGLGHRGTRQMHDLTPPQPPSIKWQRRFSG